MHAIVRPRHITGVVSAEAKNQATEKSLEVEPGWWGSTIADDRRDHSRLPVVFLAGAAVPQARGCRCARRCESPRRHQRILLLDTGEQASPQAYPLKSLSSVSDVTASDRITDLRPRLRESVAVRIAAGMC